MFYALNRKNALKFRFFKKMATYPFKKRKNFKFLNLINKIIKSKSYPQKLYFNFLISFYRLFIDKIKIIITYYINMI